MDLKDKHIIAKYIDDHKADIIHKYKSEISIKDIAKYYGVARSTISIRLNKWGILVKRYVGPKLRAIERLSKIEAGREFSPEFLKRRKENTKINEEYFEKRRSKLKLTDEGDQKLVTEVTKNSSIGEVW